MTKQPFEPTVKEDLNRPYNVTLTEGQISTILYYLDVAFSNISEDMIPEGINEIYAVLEGAVDSYYDGVKKAQALQPKPEWDDYGSKVDALVDSMNPTFHMDQAFARAREEL